MFKTLARWIAAIPWWLLLIGGPLLIGIAIYRTADTGTGRFLDAAATPELKAAIGQEIKKAREAVTLDIASAGVDAALAVARDPNLRAELEDALREIADAKDEIERAQEEVSEARKEAAHAAAEAVAEGEVAKKEAEAAVKQAEKDLARAKEELKGKFKDAEKLKEARAGQDGKRRINIDIDLNDIPPAPHTPLPSLAEELRAEIGSQVKQDVRRVAIGGGTIVALVLLLLTLVAAKSIISVNRALKSRAARSEEVAQQASLSRQLMEARLAAMQAQIEPHFLFNTLASVDHLIETDPPAASKMQKNLIAYLRAAIPQMREASTTLGREAEMCRAYLNILAVRMEARLRFTIDIADGLKNAPFPPMMLPTLTENAIKHGLEPKPEGGEIRISAARHGDKLKVSVCDTGMGFADQPGSGVGLANIRERLHALYGKAAALTLEPNTPSGTIASIEIPFANARSNAKSTDRR